MLLKKIEAKRRDFMANNIRWGLDNPHRLSQTKMVLISEGKYDEWRR